MYTKFSTSSWFHNEYFKFFEFLYSCRCTNIDECRTHWYTIWKDSKFSFIVSHFFSRDRSIRACVISVDISNIQRERGSGLKKKNKARAYFIRKNAKLKSKWLIKKKEGKRHQGVENISQARRAKRIKSQTLPVNLETLSLELSKLSLSSSIEIVWMKMSIRF